VGTRRKLAIVAALVAVATVLLALLGFERWQRPPAPRLFDGPFDARGVVLAARHAAGATEMPAGGALVVAFPADLDWTALRLDELERVADCAHFVTTNTAADGSFTFRALDGGREWFALAFADGCATYPLVPLPLLPDEEHTHRLGPLLGAGVRFVDANGEPHRELRFVRGLGDRLVEYPFVGCGTGLAPGPQPIWRSWFEALLLLATGVDRAHRGADTHWLIEHAVDHALARDRGSVAIDRKPPGFVCDAPVLFFGRLGPSAHVVDVVATPTTAATGSLAIAWRGGTSARELAESGTGLILGTRDFDGGIYLDIDRLARHDALTSAGAVIDGLPVGTYTLAPARRSLGSHWDHDPSVTVIGTSSVTITALACANVLLERPPHAALHLRWASPPRMFGCVHGAFLEGASGHTLLGAFDPTFRRIVGIPPGRWSVAAKVLFPHYMLVSESPPWIVPRDVHGFWTTLAAAFTPPTFEDDPRVFQFEFAPGGAAVATWLEFTH
jgi:hypothetical protein